MITLMTTLPTTTSFNNKRLTKVSWQKELEIWSDDEAPIGTEWVTWTSTALMPWVFKASTLEETIEAAHQLKFGRNHMDSLTPLEDGSFLMTFAHGTLRVLIEQDAHVPRQKTIEEFEGEQACMWHDWE